MKVVISETKEELGTQAATLAAELIRKTIAEKGFANIILATGTSQFQTLEQLIREENIDWGKVTMFHLDEFIALPLAHAASFRKYLKERFLDKVPPLKAVHLINGEGNITAEIENLNSIISHHPIDVALVGIGENGHLAFNDPPADFENEKPYHVVNLDEPCRMQQMGEGWFGSLDEVPLQAISMTVKQIMKSEHIVCSVPDERKALAVRNSLTEEVSNIYPASILQNHAHCTFFLDKSSASLLPESVIA
ncbi:MULTISPECIES: glucosamine-6-phosphate deaminase [Dyadobacter]|uniref:Glucosamine-6-phosphate deaminase n=1 Tax=Dyadobacter chenhuakuii TaxID=2909339 RepID=A0ABY4XIX6_9BACT|nr:MULTISPECIES: glucosamine-6-phosphate deaminase [Dyadobacter]MCF2496100.1 glucosamine-6-phosphate deaminase [Dyadobacter chenhuakuii]MCF2520051.1 glucosamine-6-phosphate deaminase [Dyadobacter sp. CY351]USJ30165.1 glucosamine-6-phosphate deaminase [Dyadobacter chenhuakuii]